MQQEGIGYRFVLRIKDYYDSSGYLLGQLPSGKNVIVKEHYVNSRNAPYSRAKDNFLGQKLACEIIGFEGDVAVARQLTKKDFR